VVCTNTLPLGPDKQIDKIEQLSVAPIIGGRSTRSSVTRA
jgi:hypothetical protein